MTEVFEASPTFLQTSFDVQNMSAVNAQSPKTSNNTLQTTLQNLAKNRTSSIDSNNSSSDLRNNHHNTGGSKEEIWEGSLHSYHAWLKEKQKEEEEKKKTNPVSSLSNNNYKFTTTTSTSATTPGSSVKDEDEEEEEVNQDDSSYQVDDIMERGPSPPENNENSNSYEWSYEEQFKQLYEIDSDPDRKLFLDEYFEFMKGRGTPVSRIPIMAKQILDLFQLYHLVVKHGGLVQVIRNKLWSKITKGLNLPTSITSAAFTLRTQYLKYLYPYECSMHNFSTPKELQAAIDSNRRDRFSTLYHAEPTMTPSRDDRYGPFHHEYPMPPRHHMSHMGMTQPPPPPSQSDMRYGMKRAGDPIYSSKYGKYGGMDSPKVIVLQDGTPSMADHHLNKGSPPPSYYTRTRSPPSSRGGAGDMMRSKPDMESVRMRTHHHYSSGYSSTKDWDSEPRHVIEEERRRMMEDRSRTSAPICKDKNCNGIDCKYTTTTRPELHRHRSSHDPMSGGLCACSYCKDYTRTFSPTSSRHQDISLPVGSKHHMDGASAASSLPPNSSRLNSGLHSSPLGISSSQTPSKQPPIRRSSSGGVVVSPRRQETSPSTDDDVMREDDHDDDDDVMMMDKRPNNTTPSPQQQLTTFKMKLPDLRKGGNQIQISLEVGDIVYEGVICANLSPVSNGSSMESEHKDLNGH